ncbi:hypothetical protein DFH27DRAFT_488819 [Peziza echinospora]|nr:hypothetical protein DFH27DRAFT_488819 [Peziza echinospora]
MDDDEQEYLRKYRQSRQKTQDTTTPANTIDDDIIAFIKAFFGLILAPLKIFKGVILLLRVPITFLIFLYVLFLVIITSGRVLFTAAGHALAPICNLPGLENLPFCGYDGTPPDWLSYTHWVQPLPGKEEDLRRPDFPRLIDLQTKFMGVIETAEASSIMGIELKNAELSIRDLGSLVSLSDLKCKDLLNDEIGRFVRDSKILTNLLRRLEAGVGGVVDRTVIMNNYAIFELDRVRNIETEGGSGYFQVLFLKPFFFRNPQLSPIQQVRLQISAVFLESSTRLEKELRKLIEDAEVILDRLEQLEKHLSNIYTIINTENKRVTGEQDRVLAEIWTMLGGNKRKIKNFNRHQNLLENVGEYRARALEQVGRTLVQLQGMYAGLEELKSSTSRDVIGDDSSAIPIEVHIQALREGALRLGQNKDAARENFLRKKKKALEKFSQFDLPDEKPLTRGIADQPGPQKRKYTAPGK